MQHAQKGGGGGGAGKEGGEGRKGRDEQQQSSGGAVTGEGEHGVGGLVKKKPTKAERRALQV